MKPTEEFQQRMARIEGLVHKLESAPDPALRRTAQELVESLMELHGAGLERMIDILKEAGETGAAILSSVSSDELAGSLLVLYGLHPDDFETRVQRGLDKVRPLLRSEGARLDQVVIANDMVRLKLVGGDGRLETLVRNALLEAAPDAADVSIEGTQPVLQPGGFVPLSSLLALNGVPAVTGTGRP